MKKKYILRRMNFVNNRDKIRQFYLKWPPYLVTRSGTIIMIIHIRHSSKLIFFSNVLNVAVIIIKSSVPRAGC